MSSNSNQSRPIGGYIPNVVPAVIGAVLFAACGTIFLTRRVRQGYTYMNTLWISTFCITVGFAMRIATHYLPSSLGIYIVQTLFILLPPCGFFAQNYILLPRLASALHATDQLWMKPTRIVKLFVWSDVTTFWLQAAGGGLSVQPSLANIGHWIALVGLVAQAISFGFFTCLLLHFGNKVRGFSRNRLSGYSSDIPLQTPPLGFTAAPTHQFPIRWRAMLNVMCGTCVGYLVRSIYRIIEYSQGYDGYIPTHEVYFYCFDTIPLFLAISLFTIWWPPLLIGNPVKPGKEVLADGQYTHDGKDTSGLRYGGDMA